MDSTLALGELMSTPMVALASSVEIAWRGPTDSFYLGQEGSEITFGILMWRWNFIGLMSGDVLCLPWGERKVTIDRSPYKWELTPKGVNTRDPKLWLNTKAVIMSSSYLHATTESHTQAEEAKKPSEAISILYCILENPLSSSEALRIKEKAISNLSDLLREENRAEELRNLLTQLRPFFALIPESKTAKIWTHAEKRTFLRQRGEARLASLLIESKEYSEALTLLSGLIKEVRRLDDKLLLVDIELLESKLHFSLRNLPNAKATLTAARTAANSIYVPPDPQGTIDLQSGIIHVEEKDYKTAYSYFYVAFEAFNALEDPRAIYNLKYMLLCKIMDTLLEQNLCRLIEPFSRGKIAHIAELNELPIDHVGKKLSQMILDKKFAGTLEQRWRPFEHWQGRG
ncbi:non-ATPase subunit 9 [Actinidia rufa]|uniref:Non-ATPase subunit 9 n=1 Tax=Actinidia rufa TaxID=165716 RepID=A0A7J0G3T1_9ERIC|nr:non-ATPase subunit 9 [Actinidia rufa]